MKWASALQMKIAVSGVRTQAKRDACVGIGEGMCLREALRHFHGLGSVSRFMPLKKHFLRRFFLFVMLFQPAWVLAQELEPRRWSHIPTGMNLAGAGYVYTESDIFFDPVLLLSDVEMEMSTWAAKYLYSFELFGKSARIDFAQGYQEGSWAGLINGVPSSIKRDGLTDSLVRFAINLHGAPPLQGQEYADYLAKTDVETVVGLGLIVQLPTGEYMDDKLINLGTNRLTFRPQIGVEHRWGPWSFELTGDVSVYTDNDEFFNGNRRAQEATGQDSDSVAVAIAYFW